MKIVETIFQREEYDFLTDFRVDVSLTSDNGKTRKVSFYHDEPEDMFLHRSLNDAYEILDLVLMAYEAGKNGEKLIVEKIEDRPE